MSDEEREVLSPRELRRRRREELKKKSTGTGLSISVEKSQKQSNKKTFFDKDIPPENDEGKNQKDIVIPQNVESDDGDDDAVEEAQTSNERKAFERKREAEEEIARIATTMDKKRKKKRKIQVEDMDDEVFASIDAEMELKKSPDTETEQRGIPKTFLGKRTTFVLSGSHEPSKPLPQGHNIEVVVLPKESDPSLPVTNTARKYARRFIQDGTETLSQKQIQKQKKMGQNITSKVHWSRSKKMGRILGSSAKQRKVGRTAPQFVTKM